MTGPKETKQDILFGEIYRQTLHSAVALFIIPLHWFGFWYAVGFALIAFFWNLWAMPRWFPGTLRPLEKQKGYSKGMLNYPVCILILALLFPLPVAAAGWAVLSLSDGFATIIGRLLGKKPLPWNKNKTWIGSLTYFATATIFGAIAFLWTCSNTEGSSLLSLKWTSPLLGSYSAGFPGRFSPYRADFWTIFWITGLVAGLVESLPFRKLDDNLVAPICYALTITFLIIFVARHIMF